MLENFQVQHKTEQPDHRILSQALIILNLGPRNHNRMEPKMTALEVGESSENELHLLPPGVWHFSTV